MHICLACVNKRMGIAFLLCNHPVKQKNFFSGKAGKTILVELDQIDELYFTNRRREPAHFKVG